MSKNVFFNVLAKDLANAMEISAPAPEKILVGLTVKQFATNEEAVNTANEYKKNNVLVSIGLGAGDPAMWERVVQVSSKCLPYHINQVFPAAGYTKGVMDALNHKDCIINSLITPSDDPEFVYISTGAVSEGCKDVVSVDTAAKMMADIGLNSVKFYPVGGNKKIENIKAMAKAAANNGIEIFEPTGSLSVENVHEVVEACFNSGMKTVIPHLYTSLVNKETGCTELHYIEELLNMKW